MIAVDLSPKARALIRANRDERRPTAADRERVTAALRAQLGVTVLPLDTLTSVPLTSTGIPRRFAAAFGLCVVGSVLFLARKPGTPIESATRRHDQVAQAMPAATSTSPLGSASATPETPVILEQKPPAPVPRRVPPKVAAPPPAQDTLGQELALLTSAATQLSSGQADAALAAIEEHQRRFSHGILSDERSVAKARALCMLHRFDEGRAALARLAAGTPAAARAQEECDTAFARANAANPSSTR